MQTHLWTLISVTSESARLTFGLCDQHHSPGPASLPLCLVGRWLEGVKDLCSFLWPLECCSWFTAQAHYHSMVAVKACGVTSFSLSFLVWHCLLGDSVCLSLSPPPPFGGTLWTNTLSLVHLFWHLIRDCHLRQLKSKNWQDLLPCAAKCAPSCSEEYCKSKCNC